MKKLIAYLILLLLACCTDSKSVIVSNITHTIKPNYSISSSGKLSSIVEDSRVIEFESTPKFLISNIYKIELFDQHFFVLDKVNFSSGGKLLVFDLKGKFIREIGGAGRAYNEHLSLGGFAINKSNNEIVILDDTAQKLMFFDIKGEFIRSQKLDFVARQIEILDDGQFVFAMGGQGNDRLVITDKNCNIKESMFGSNDKNSMVLLNFFTKSKNEIIYRNYLNDTIYSISSGNGVRASRFVDFGDNALTWGEFMNYNQSERRNIESYFSKYNCNLKYYSETDNFIWSLFFAKGTPQCLLYDKTSGMNYVYDVNMLNDITYDNFVPLIIGSNEEWFIAQNNPLSTSEYIDNTTLEESDREREIRGIITRNGDDCNPIITLIKFKNLK